MSVVKLPTLVMPPMVTVQILMDHFTAFAMMATHWIVMK